MNNILHKNLKILFVSSDKYPPFRVDVSILFGKEMVNRGHVIDWILQSNESCKKSYKTTWSEGNVWVGATDNGSSRHARLKKHLLDIKNDLKLVSFVKKNHYDFIIIKDKFISALLALYVTRTLKTKALFWLSFPFPEESLYSAKVGLARYPLYYRIRGVLLKWLLYKIIIPQVNHVFVQSEQMKKDVIAMGVSSRSMTVVPMGVSLDMFPDPRKKNTTRVETDNNIVYLGTLDRGRRLDFLLRVFERVLKCLPNSKLYFIGDGDDPVDKMGLQNECVHLGIQYSVIFTGFIDREKALNYVSIANVCVSPFFPNLILNSTSPTKLIEYMAMGKPVVANDHPEQRLVIEQSEGGLCVPYDEASFAQAIIHLLTHPQLAEEMGIKGRYYVEEHRCYKKIADLVENKLLTLSQSLQNKI